MTGYLIAGLIFGAIYAIAASGIVITFTSTGILNFAFAAEAYFVARMYYYFDSSLRLGIVPSLAITLFAATPLMGFVLYVALFRFLRLAPTIVKVVATIGLAVTLPPLAIICFGNDTITTVPGLAPRPVATYSFLGTVVSLDQIIVLGTTAALGVIGVLVLRFTAAGLAVRSMIDSPAMTSLTGANPTVIAVCVRVSMTFLAGLTGILLAPVVGLASQTDFILLVIAAFAAVVVGRLRYVGRAIAGGLLLGIIQGILDGVIPSRSAWLGVAELSTPFVVITVFLLYYAATSKARETSMVGGELDSALTVTQPAAEQSPRLAPQREGTAGRLRIRAVRPADVMALATLVVGVLLPLMLHGILLSGLGMGYVLAVIFLSYTVITGEGGLVSLCQITFAGIGGLATAQFATTLHWPPLLALVAGGVVAVPFGLAIGVISLLMDEWYFTIVTLTAGLLVENLLFSLNRFSQQGAGVLVDRPSGFSGDQSFAYLALAVFCLFALFVVSLRRGTSGLAASALRSSPAAAQTLGIRIAPLRLALTATASLIAGLGGGLLAMYQLDASPLSFATLDGLIWLAVVVVMGRRSCTAALIAGVTYAIIPVVILRYLPIGWAQLPPALFGLGAILVAKNPDGALAMHGRQLRSLVRRGRDAHRNVAIRPGLERAEDSYAETAAREPLAVLEKKGGR